MGIKKKSVTWCDHEDKALCDFLTKKGKNWCAIARELNKFYGYKKTGRQCRQRWYNQLDPTIIKNQWTEKEEDILFSEHRKVGNRWKLIAKKLNGRSDNSIKNHFYSTIRRSLRWINKNIKGSKDGTRKVRNIKPTILSNFFSISSEVQSMKSESLIKLREVAYNMIDLSRRITDKDYKLSKQEKSNFLNFLEEIYTLHEKSQISRKKKEKQEGDMDSDGQSSSDSEISYRIYQKKNQVKGTNFSNEDQIKAEQNQDRCAEEENLNPQQAYVDGIIKGQMPYFSAPKIEDKGIQNIKQQGIASNFDIQIIGKQTSNNLIKESQNPTHTSFCPTFYQLSEPDLFLKLQPNLGLPTNISIGEDTSSSQRLIKALMDQIMRLRCQVFSLKNSMVQTPAMIFQGPIYFMQPAQSDNCEKKSSCQSCQKCVEQKK